jgi:hypothetical protein
VTDNRLILEDVGPGTVAVATAAGVPLLHYVYAPHTPANEATRPYMHPLHGPTGEVLTNFRPNDHPWHHGLSLTLTRVGDVNFWGGPSHRAEDGYKWRDDHGAQVHRQWKRREPGCLGQALDWCNPGTGETLLHELRTIEITRHDDTAWSLRWRSELLNVAGHALELGNYHASSGLAGSHYTGLQFRGARDLLDEHRDAAVMMRAATGAETPETIHGKLADWMEWDTQHDSTLRRTRIRFESLSGAIPWFVRRDYPLAAFAPHFDATLPLPAGHPLVLDHRLTFSRL